MLLWLLCMLASCVAAASPSSCPSVCFCPLDPRGRRQVICNTGGLVDPLPVLEMPSDVEVLEVGSPPGRPNALTLGPIFKGHRRLEMLSVTGSGVPALGAHSFWGLRRLHTLNVSHNAITALIDTNFRGADSLHTLDLSHNQVESVPSAVFRHIRHLRYLSLANNRLPEVVPRVLYGLSLLEALDISHNPLGILPPDRFTDAPNLRELRCAACGLQAVTEQLMKALPELRLLDLRQNRLTEVPPLALSRHLVTLNLDSNHISALISNGLSGPPLSTLTLSNNRLSTMSPQAMANSSLTFLDLAYNRLTRLRSDALSDGFTRLRYLRLTANPIRVDKLLQVIPRARQLRHLELSELTMTHLPGDLLRQSRHLKILNVSGNFLSDFPVSALFATPHLITLDLSHNNFRGLQQDLVTAFTTMASLEQVWMQGNPWQCQRCHVAPMLDWLRDPNASHHPHAESVCRDMPISPRCLRCAGPQELVGQELQLLNKTHIPECVQEAPAWPVWLGGAQNDDPRSHNEQHPQESAEEESFDVFFGDHMALIVGVGCGLVLALLLVVAAAFLLARRHSALYYTHEPADQDSSQKLMSRNNNDNSPPGPRGPQRTPYTSRTGVTTPYTEASIATIEEVDSIAGSSIDLKVCQELRAPRIVRLAASPLP
ncbi:hypothetical protein OTU49_001542 [Cherax quadricarinatus]|uniref:Uncharacterized protein n=1 Tax=Cherax quadricarinatus TaxID=27406 RepID=A0AAW0XUJ1_CHEQU|nr:insulin-like growth factor-binding protein complex acid labile subunit [Cherax quadricarinatus]XP_053636475.1 insulin-like growth factor-binding protein complex acid labile subunit [Cherax quadricarinatus]